MIVSTDGYILTNNHVVDNASAIKVELSDRRVLDGKLIGDPSAQQSAKSEFGSANSVLIVSPVPR